MGDGFGCVLKSVYGCVDIKKPSRFKNSSIFSQIQKAMYRIYTAVYRNYTGVLIAAKNDHKPKYE
jgi:hypothetical protein